MADERTTLLSSVFMSATVCRTVDSKLASSIAPMPSFALPRATRPARLKMSEKNAMSGKLRSNQVFCMHNIGQQKIDAREDVVLVVRPHVLQLAEIIQRNRGSGRAAKQLKVG